MSFLLIYFAIGIFIAACTKLDTGRISLSEPLGYVIAAFWPLFVLRAIATVEQITFNGKVIWRRYR